MTRYTILIFILWIATGHTKAQQHTKLRTPPSNFTLDGTIAADTGTMELFTKWDDAYLPVSLVGAKAKIFNGKFTFTGNIDYPCWVEIGFKKNDTWAYLSDDFYIEPGRQSIICDSVRENPQIYNNCMKEYSDQYSRSYREVRIKAKASANKHDSLQKLYGDAMPTDIKAELDNERNIISNEVDTVLLQYAMAHTGSYVALWQLVNYVQFQYKPVYHSVFNQFSKEVQNSRTGKLLKQKLDAARSLAISAVFPKLVVKDMHNTKQTIPKKNSTVVYTLVDFWFTHCTPCKQQLPALKKLYDTYHKNGFDIIGISTDQKQYVEDWKKMIVEKELNWLQYIDVGGLLANKLAIDGFPRNYLLDKDGRILKKDIRMGDLERFLKTNLVNGH